MAFWGLPISPLSHIREIFCVCFLYRTNYVKLCENKKGVDKIGSPWYNGGTKQEKEVTTYGSKNLWDFSKRRDRKTYWRSGGLSWQWRPWGCVVNPTKDWWPWEWRLSLTFVFSHVKYFTYSRRPATYVKYTTTGTDGRWRGVDNGANLCYNTSTTEKRVHLCYYN